MAESPMPVYDLTSLINDSSASLPSKPAGKKRIELMDECRGFCVLLMLVYHATYLLMRYFGVKGAGPVFAFFEPIQPSVAAVFILISGVSTRLSRDPAKRGFWLLAIALGVSLVTIVILPGVGVQNAAVWFGVLHLLAVGKLLFNALRKPFEKCPIVIGFLLMLLLFCYTFKVSNHTLSLFGLLEVRLPDALYNNNILFALGFHNKSFSSFDYFPLLPYLFLFFAGAFMGGIAAKKGGLPDFVYSKHFSFLGVVGKHALLFYIFHIPFFFGIFYLFLPFSSV